MTTAVEAAPGPGPAVPPAPPSRLGRNISALAGGQLFNFAMGLAWTLVVPRVLGPAGMGHLVTAWSATAVLGVVVGLGTRTYLVRECVADPSSAPSLVGTAVVLRLCVAPFFIGAVALYSSLTGFSGEQQAILYLSAGATLLTLLGEPMLAVFQAVERMEYLALSDMAIGGMASLIGVCVALVGFRAAGITASWMIVAGFVFALNIWWVRAHLRIDWRTNFAKMRRLVSDSVAYWAFGLFFMVYLWIDSVILAAMTPAKVVGWYGVPTKLFQALIVVAAILSVAWLPRLVTAFEDSPDRLRAVARVPMELVVVLSIPISVATAMAARPVIGLLYGSPYRNAVPVLVILGFCLPPMYLNIMLSQVLVASKRQVAWTWVMAGATVVNPALNIVLVGVCQSRYGNGAIGAAMSMVLTETLIVLVGMMIVGRHVLGLGSLWRFARTGVAAAAMWGVGQVVSPLGSVASLVAGSITFLLLAIVLRLASRHDVDLLIAGLGRLRAKVRR